MDFAENFSCRSMDEIQTAYWNQTGVTLHPIVVYYMQNGNLKHKSLVMISDDMNHSAGTVKRFIEDLIPQLLEIDPEMMKIYYWTDSPSSQYRNRYMFNDVASHGEMYGILATWNYFDAGHGKGPRDVLGDTVKRLADEVIFTGGQLVHP